MGHGDGLIVIVYWYLTFLSRLAAGVEKGAYYHPLFLRSKRFLAHYIHRSKVKGTGVRRRCSPETEPNFLGMSYLPPSGGVAEQKERADERQETAKPGTGTVCRSNCTALSKSPIHSETADSSVETALGGSNEASSSIDGDWNVANSIQSLLLASGDALNAPFYSTTQPNSNHRSVMPCTSTQFVLSCSAGLPTDMSRARTS